MQKPKITNLADYEPDTAAGQRSNVVDVRLHHTRRMLKHTQRNTANDTFSHEDMFTLHVATAAVTLVKCDQRRRHGDSATRQHGSGMNEHHITH